MQIIKKSYGLTFRLAKFNLKVKTLLVNAEGEQWHRQMGNTVKETISSDL